jgi:hypothetical protein
MRGAEGIVNNSGKISFGWRKAVWRRFYERQRGSAPFWAGFQNFNLARA